MLSLPILFSPASNGVQVPERRVNAKVKDVQDPDLWTAVRFRVNSFTAEEWPSQEPSSFEDFSIGEEQSLSTVTALSWSAPGLGKHRRSVLAVLTSNLVLSLWESKADPREQDSWERVLLIHHSLRDYFSSHDDNANAPDARAGSLRQRTRIRASAWAEPLRWERDHGNHSFQSKWGVFLLAVTNDRGEIIILRIVSPYSMETGQSSKWDAVVLWHGKASQLTRVESQIARHVHQSLLSASMVAKRFILDLIWGSWMCTENHNALLTYTWGAQIYSLKVFFSLQPVQITVASEFEHEFTPIATCDPVHSSASAPSDCSMLSCCYKQAHDVRFLYFLAKGRNNWQYQLWEPLDVSTANGIFKPILNEGSDRDGCWYWTQNTPKSVFVVKVLRAS